MNSFIIVALVFSLAISAIAHTRDGARGPPGGGRGGPQPGGHHGGPPPGGHHGGPHHGGFHGGPPHGGPHGPPPSMYDMFPACKTLAESMRAKHSELHDSGEIGPRNCQGGDHKVCMQRDMETVRCAVTEAPQEECIQEMMAFIQGDICDGGREQASCDSCDSTENEDSL